MYRLPFGKKTGRVFQYIDCEGGGGCKLAKTVSFRLCLDSFELGLKRKTLFLKKVESVFHDQMPNLAKSPILCSQTQSIPSAAS